jgi:hypothetical protein
MRPPWGPVHSQGAEEVPHSKVMRVTPREDCKKRGGIRCSAVMENDTEYHRKMPTFLKRRMAEHSYRLRGSVPITEFEVEILDVLSGCRRYSLPTWQHCSGLLKQWVISESDR